MVGRLTAQRARSLALTVCLTVAILSPVYAAPGPHRHRDSLQIPSLNIIGLHHLSGTQLDNYGNLQDRLRASLAFDPVFERPAPKQEGNRTQNLLVNLNDDKQLVSVTRQTAPLPRSLRVRPATAPLAEKLLPAPSLCPSHRNHVPEGPEPLRLACEASA